MRNRYAWWRKRRADDQEDDIRQYHTRGHADLNEASIKAAPIGGSILNREQRCSAPLTTDGEPLDKSQNHQKKWCERAYRRV